MKIKVNDTEFIDTDKLRKVCSDAEGIAVLYYAPESKRFFRVIPAGYKSENEDIEECHSSFAYDFLLQNVSDADVINKRITALFPDKPQLQEVL
jgi:hypothetical protein